MRQRKQRDVLMVSIGVSKIRNVKRFQEDIILVIEDIYNMIMMMERMEMVMVMGPVTGMEMVMAILAMVTVAMVTAVAAMVVENK